MMRYIDRGLSPALDEGFWGEAELLDGEGTALMGISICHELVLQLADLVPNAPESLRCDTPPMTFCMTFTDRARSSGWRRKGRALNEVRRYYASASYRVHSWNKPQRVLARVEWHRANFIPALALS